MPPLVPVASRAKVPAAVIEPEVVKAPAPLALSVKLMLLPVEVPLPVVAVLSTKVTLPVVLAVQLGVAIFNEPIAPEPLVNAADVEPVTVPVVCVILPEPEAVIVSAVPETLPPNTMPPFVPVASNANVPAAVIEPDVVKAPAPLALSVKLMLFPVEAPLPVVATLSTNVTLPVVLAVQFGVAIFNEPIAPEPLVNAADVEPVTVPLVWVIVPEPEAVIVSTVPDALPPRTMPPLVPLASKAKVPAAVIVPEVVNAPAPLALSVKLILLPVEAPLPVVAVLSTNVTLPVVLAVQLGVAIFNEPMAPEPLVNAAEVEPVTVPLVWVIGPEPFAVIVSTVPEALPPRTMPPLVPVASKASVPEAVIEPEVVKAPAPLALSVKLMLLPVDTPLPVVAVLSTKVTLPEVLAVQLGVAIFSEPMAPEPLVNAAEVEPVTVPAVWVILPEPFAVIVSAVPLTFPPNTIPPLVPVASNAKVPAAVIVPEVVKAPAPPAVSVKLMLLPVDIPLPVVAVLSTRVTLPVVLAVQLGVAIFNEPIAPEPVVNAAEVEPVTVPPV